jgi:hypothetical protein
MVAGSRQKKMRQQKTDAYSDRETGIHFRGEYAAGYERRNPTTEIWGGEGLRRPFRVMSEFKSVKRAR